MVTNRSVGLMGGCAAPMQKVCRALPYSHYAPVKPLSHLGRAPDLRCARALSTACPYAPVRASERACRANGFRQIDFLQRASPSEALLCARCASAPSHAGGLHFSVLLDTDAVTSTVGRVRGRTDLLDKLE
eukprot:1180460-Prorocentrum_minimum.AAC.3